MPENAYDRLSFLDNSFLIMETATSPMHIAASATFEAGPLQTADGGIDIDHVRHTALPKPGDERQLRRLAARVMAQHLDRQKPLWEIWILEGLADPARFVMRSASPRSGRGTASLT